jgi:hypothetical protein
VKNKLRSALTMLGIVIGVAAVIATAAIGSGAKRRIQQQIATIGSNTIVLTGSLASSGLRTGTGIVVTLSESDVHELPAECPDIVLAVPVGERRTPNRLRKRQLQSPSSSVLPRVFWRCVNSPWPRASHFPSVPY